MLELSQNRRQLTILEAVGFDNLLSLVQNVRHVDLERQYSVNRTLKRWHEGTNLPR